MSREPRARALAASTGRLREVLGDQAGRLGRTFRLSSRPAQRTLPRVRIRIGPRVPGPVLRLAVAAVALGCAAVLSPGPATWSLAVLGTLLLIWRPSGIVCGIYAFTLGVALATSASAPFAPRSFLLLFGVHLLVQLGALASNVPWNSVVDLRVLVGPGRRFLVWQLTAQLLALGGAALTTTAVTVPWLPVLAGVSVTVLLWWLLSRLIAPPE